MPNSQGSMEGKTPPLSRRRMHFISKSDTRPVQRIDVDPKYKSEAKSEEDSEVELKPLDKAAVKKVLVFTSENLSTLASDLNNSEPLQRINKVKSKPQEKSRNVKEVKQKLVIDVHMVQIFTPLDKILESHCIAKKPIYSQKFEEYYNENLYNSAGSGTSSSAPLLPLSARRSPRGRDNSLFGDITHKHRYLGQKKLRLNIEDKFHSESDEHNGKNKSERCRQNSIHLENGRILQKELTNKPKTSRPYVRKKKYDESVVRSDDPAIGVRDGEPREKRKRGNPNYVEMITDADVIDFDWLSDENETVEKESPVKKREKLFKRKAKRTDSLNTSSDNPNANFHDVTPGEDKEEAIHRIQSHPSFAVDMHKIEDTNGNAISALDYKSKNEEKSLNKMRRRLSRLTTTEETLQAKILKVENNEKPVARITKSPFKNETILDEDLSDTDEHDCSTTNDKNTGVEYLVPTNHESNSISIITKFEKESTTKSTPSKISSKQESGPLVPVAKESSLTTKPIRSRIPMDWSILRKRSPGQNTEQNAGLEAANSELVPLLKENLHPESDKSSTSPVNGALFLPQSMKRATPQSLSEEAVDISKKPIKDLISKSRPKTPLKKSKAESVSSSDNSSSVSIGRSSSKTKHVVAENETQIYSPKKPARRLDFDSDCSVSKQKIDLNKNPSEWSPSPPTSPTFVDSDLARPSRNVVRPVRLGDQLQQAQENLAIMKLPQTVRNQLPYNLDCLDWNADHTINTQGTYCYCGSAGDWYNRMVCCVRCTQWFHERCLAPRPMAMPIIPGDPFWIFVCSICNSGSECLKRMEPTWTDLVHLTIFDLTLKTDGKFHDFTVDFMPFFESSWDSLQLSKKFTNLPKERKRTEVKDVLGSDPRFEEGVESGQQKDLWGLRVLAPPRRPPYRVPSVGIIQDRTVLNEVTIEEQKVVKSEECSAINIRDLNIVYKEYRPPEVCTPSTTTPTPHFSSQVISQSKPLDVHSKVTELSTVKSLVSRPDVEVISNCQATKVSKSNDNCQTQTEPENKKKSKLSQNCQAQFDTVVKKYSKINKTSPGRSDSQILKDLKHNQNGEALVETVAKKDSEQNQNCLAQIEAEVKEDSKLNQNCQSSPNGVQLTTNSVTKPLPYEISKILHKRGYPKVAMKFASVIPPKKSVVVEALITKETKKISKKKKSMNYNIASNDMHVLEALIPVQTSYVGSQNPFMLGSIEEQRAARNLLCNRKLNEDDLTNIRSKIKKRKYRLCIEESRRLWKNREEGDDSYQDTKYDQRLAGRVIDQHGEMRLIMTTTSKDESLIQNELQISS